MLGGDGGRRGLVATGDVQGKLMFHQQPMKMARPNRCATPNSEPNFSILSVGTHNNCDSITHVIEVPYVLPFLAKGNSPTSPSKGQGPSVAVREAQFGPGWYIPNLFVTYWAFRAMIGPMAIPMLFAVWAPCG